MHVVDAATLHPRLMTVSICFYSSTPICTGPLGTIGIHLTWLMGPVKPSKNLLTTVTCWHVHLPRYQCLIARRVVTSTYAAERIERLKTYLSYTFVSPLKLSLRQPSVHL